MVEGKKKVHLSRRNKDDCKDDCKNRDGCIYFNSISTAKYVLKYLIILRLIFAFRCEINGQQILCDCIHIDTSNLHTQGMIIQPIGTRNIRYTREQCQELCKNTNKCVQWEWLQFYVESQDETFLV